MISALSFLNQERIVHRDIKPDNIMYRYERSEAVLVDFGLVRDLNASSLTQAFLPHGPGTPYFSAPEQLNNEKAMIDWRTDQFALGITLCMAFLGVHPFEADMPIAAIEKVARKERCNATVAHGLIESGLSPIVKMIEPYPIRRYRTPEQLKTDWQKLGGTC